MRALLIKLCTLALTFSIFAFPYAAFASVGFDAVGPSSAGTNCLACTTLSWSHTVSGSNTLLVVTVADSDDSDTLTATYNGVSMTSLSKVHSNNTTAGFVQMFYLVAPATGANTVLISGITSVVGEGAEGGSVSFTGVNQSTPMGTPATAASAGVPASVAVSSISGDMVVWGLASGDAPSAPTQTGQWIKAVNSDTAAGNAAMQTANGTGSSITGQWTIANGDFWGIIGADIQAAAGARVIRLRGGVRLRAGVRFR